MGTRHLIGVMLDGDFKVAQYGQWDGYPGGQGTDILAFLRSADMGKFKERVREVRWMTEEDRDLVEEIQEAAGADGSGFVTLEVAEKINAALPSLSRDTCAGILPLILDGGVEFLQDNRDFAFDSLFCEWAYVIDLDKEILQVYKGFQKDLPKAGLWAGQRRAGEEYAAVDLAGEWKISDLPTDAEFCAALDPMDDEDE